MVVLKLVLAFPLNGLQAECVLGGQHGSVEVADLVLLTGKEAFEKLDDAAVFLLVEGHLFMVLSDPLINCSLEFFLPIPEQVDLLLEVLLFFQVWIILGLQVEVLPGYEVGLFELCKLGEGLIRILQQHLDKVVNELGNRARIVEVKGS